MERHEQTRGRRPRCLSSGQKWRYRVFPIRTDTTTTSYRKDRWGAGLTVFMRHGAILNSMVHTSFWDILHLEVESIIPRSLRIRGRHFVVPT